MSAQNGACRIIWPGTTRQFPSTQTEDLPSSRRQLSESPPSFPSSHHWQRKPSDHVQQRLDDEFTVNAYNTGTTSFRPSWYNPANAQPPGSNNCGGACSCVQCCSGLQNTGSCQGYTLRNLFNNQNGGYDDYVTSVSGSCNTYWGNWVDTFMTCSNSGGDLGKLDIVLLFTNARSNLASIQITTGVNNLHGFDVVSYDASDQQLGLLCDESADSRPR